MDSAEHAQEWVQAIRYVLKMAKVRSDIGYLPRDEEILTLFSKRKDIAQTIIEVLIENGGLQRKCSRRKTLTIC